MVCTLATESTQIVLMPTILPITMVSSPDAAPVVMIAAGCSFNRNANILNEAAIIATKNEHKKITRDDIEEAVKKVTVGLEKKARVISDKDKRLTAYHEAGHAIVSWY